MTIKHSPVLVFLSVVAILTACSSNEIGNSRDVAPETVYQQYDVRYNESDAKVTLRAQFRFGGANGTTLVLNSPSQVSLDGEVLKVDSSDFAGAFYEAERPAAGFLGNHRFVFTDINGKKYENGWLFDPLRIAQAPASASKQQPLQLVFDSATLRNGDQIEVSTTGTDSSFSMAHTVQVGRYTMEIPAAQLARQKGKQLVLDITLQRSILLQQGTQEGGSLDMHQRLRALKVRLVP